MPYYAMYWLLVAAIESSSREGQMESKPLFLKEMPLCEVPTASDKYPQVAMESPNFKEHHRQNLMTLGMFMDFP